VVTIGAGASGILTWDTLQSGDALLDISTTTAPTIVTAGVYAVAIAVRSEAALTAGASFRVTLDLDRNGENPQWFATGPDGADARSYVMMTGVYYQPAGAVIRVTAATSTTPSGAQDFKLYAGVVQRIS
jgi:hypothetical protein